MFLGRLTELEELENMYHQDKFQLFILYGRRRIGKTALLNEFCKGKNAIFYSAEQTNDKLNLEKFSELIFAHYKEKNLESFPSWEQALLYMHERQKDRRLAVVFDEFPYLANVNAGLMSVMQHLIDHQLKDGRLFLILCGSYVGFMEKDVLGAKSPLFGRRTAQLLIKPFDYLESAAFLDGFKTLDKLLLYGIYGGTPMYLRSIDHNLPIGENVKNTFLKPTGYLYEEPLLLMRQELQEPGVYFAIAQAIASGAVRSNEIAGKSGEDAAKCIKYIAALRELGILYKELPFGAKDTARRSQYGICDPMFLFWYRYVAPNKTLIETNAGDIVWKRRIEPYLEHYMGRIFENICKDYLLRKNSRGALPVLFTDIGRWWGTDSAKKAEVEIDIVAKDGMDYIIGECKWRNEKMDYPVLASLMEKADVFSKARAHTWYVLFSKSGFTDALLRAAQQMGNVILVDAEELMR